MRLVNDKSLHALHHINRWGGWVKRPYSVLEHSILGAELLVAKGEDPRPFLLHDFEEVAFGDQVTHNKRRYMNARYHYDVDQWNAKMCAEQGITPSDLHSSSVKYVDHVMLHAEHLSVALIGDPVLFAAKPVTKDVTNRCVAIGFDAYRDVDYAIWRFWELYNVVNS